MKDKKVAQYIFANECTDIPSGETKKFSIKNPTQVPVECWGMRLKFNQAISKSLIEIKLTGQKRDVMYGATQLGLLGDARDLADSSETIPTDYIIAGTNEIEIAITARSAISAGDVAVLFYAEDFKGSKQ
ncbi:hypothetical protein AB3N59_18740 [Leptospira sp. WS92.C1]